MVRPGITLEENGPLRKVCAECKDAGELVKDVWWQSLIELDREGRQRKNWLDCDKEDTKGLCVYREDA